VCVTDDTCRTTAPPFDLIIRNASVLDGTGCPAYSADVGVHSGKIAVVGPIPASVEAGAVVDGSGLSLAPGFIDIHAHADVALLAEPAQTPKVLQGVTTEVFSNCGIGFAPVNDAAMASMRSAFGGLFSKDASVAWQWRTTGEYLSLLEAQGIGVNAAYLVPHGALRAAAMGMEGRAARPEEIRFMRAALERSLDEGARGLSTGPGYAPMSYATKDELVTLAREAGFCAIHQRDYRAELLSSTRETVEFARASGACFQLSHLQTSGPSARGLSGDAIAILDAAVHEGVDIACDMYPYTAGSTVLPAILPDWALDGGADATLARLEDSAARERIIEALDQLDRFWPAMVLMSVESTANAQYVGQSFPEIAQARNQTIGELVCDLLREERLQVCYVVHHMEDDDLETILSWNRTLIGSDGLHLRSATHPRLAGAFARWLGRYARDRRLVSLPDAVRRMTSAAADRLQLPGRGRIAVGYAADMVLFDPAAIADQATYEKPLLPPLGIHYVWVNGVAAVSKGCPTGALAGQVMRR
jgi:N-acyl-D-amino-acid deacylase